MKIGVLTFHFGFNFGAVLQCYALLETLKGMNHDPQTINFIPPNYHHPHLWQYLELKAHPAKGIQRLFIKLLYSRKMLRKFDNFRNQHLFLSDHFNIANLYKTTKLYDCIIVGSDQVWGASHFSHLSYFLEQLSQFYGRRVSYAPCCGTNTHNSVYKDRIGVLLKRFDHISVRNSETFHFVNEITGLKPPVVCDPTLLHTFDFSKQNTIKFPEEYILVFIIGNELPGDYFSIIRKIHSIYGNIPVISIDIPNIRSHLFDWVNKTIWTASPIEWVSLIQNATFILTDSFHGTLFALKFKKPFSAFYHEPSRAARFKDLASRYNIHEFIYSNLIDISQAQSSRFIPDYTKITPLLDEHIQESQFFLKTSLQ